MASEESLVELQSLTRHAAAESGARLLPSSEPPDALSVDVSFALPTLAEEAIAGYVSQTHERGWVELVPRGDVECVVVFGTSCQVRVTLGPDKVKHKVHVIMTQMSNTYTVFCT